MLIRAASSRNKPTWQVGINTSLTFNHPTLKIEEAAHT